VGGNKAREALSETFKLRMRRGRKEKHNIIVSLKGRGTRDSNESRGGGAVDQRVLNYFQKTKGSSHLRIYGATKEKIRSYRKERLGRSGESPYAFGHLKSI